MTKHPEREFLSAHLDGQTKENERPGLEAHLSSCAECRAAMEGMRAVKNALGRHMDLPRAPHHLRLRIKQLAARPRSSAGRWRWLAAAAILAAAALGWWWNRPAALPISPEMLLADHQERASEERPWELAASDSKTFAAWMEARLSRKTNLPALDGGAVLLGGRFCRSFPKPTVQAFYDMQGRRVSLFVIRDDEGELAGLASRRGMDACWKDGVLYALVSGEGGPPALDLCAAL